MGGCVALVCFVLLARPAAPEEVGGAGAPPASEASPSPPVLRLGDAAKPLRQSIELRIVPAQDRFSGTTEIDLELRTATNLLWLNGRELTVTEAHLTTSAGPQPARILPYAENFIGFAFEPAVGPGRARLHIGYTGVVNRTDTEGLFAQQDGSDWYAFTQFEPLAARRAFPGFDEPSYKIPWAIRLRVPGNLVALSNSPQVSVAEASDGMKVVEFAETPPMPSYLVAVAVGPFDLVDVGKAGRKGTPVRIVTPRGRAADARRAVEATPLVLERLEDYFDTPYPYAKLDQLAIPITVAFGAMEHPGLVTYGHSNMLRDPHSEDIAFRRGFAWTCAHELAHMWFGNFVTPAWWDDIWLNEAFANWMGTKIVNRWKPEWSERVEAMGARGYAMVQDRLATARKVRQPITSEHDISNAFDSITYVKGEAILDTFEAWVKEGPFRRGVQEYLARHAWGNATSTDFLTAISAASRPEVGAAASTFLEQAGIAVISVELACGPGRPRVKLSQKPYRPLGSRDVADKTWQVPVCIRYGGPGEARQCTLLAQAKGVLALESETCPAWLLANEDAAGYFHVRYSGDLIRQLRKGGVGLSLRERVALLQDLSAAAHSGDVRASEALDSIPSVLDGSNRHLVAATASLLTEVTQGVVTEAMRPGFARFVRDTYGERARE